MKSASIFLFAALVALAALAVVSCSNAPGSGSSNSSSSSIASSTPANSSSSTASSTPANSSSSSSAFDSGSATITVTAAGTADWNSVYSLPIAANAVKIGDNLTLTFWVMVNNTVTADLQFDPNNNSGDYYQFGIQGWIIGGSGSGLTAGTWTQITWTTTPANVTEASVSGCILELQFGQVPAGTVISLKGVSLLDGNVQLAQPFTGGGWSWTANGTTATATIVTH